MLEFMYAKYRQYKKCIIYKYFLEECQLSEIYILIIVEKYLMVAVFNRRAIQKSIIQLWYNNKKLFTTYYKSDNIDFKQEGSAQNS